MSRNLRDDLREAINCTCAYSGRFDGKSWNLKTERYDDCGCLIVIPQILSLIKDRLPEKETPIRNKSAIGDHPGIDQFNDYANGWNACLKEVKERLGL